MLPSVLRTLATSFFIGLAFFGALWHHDADRRSWLAVASLLACGTIGVLVYLNLHAGPSIGFPGLADNAQREARERDYFFVFGFWAWGIWAGVGAVVLARRLSRPAWVGVLVAAIPVVLNWQAVSRRGEAEARVPRQWAEALLENTPQRGVLMVAGDNDTYPLWYSQEVNGIRRDVVVVTLPLLSTAWYRAEIVRRYGLDTMDEGGYQGRLATATAIAAAARRQGRPVAVSSTLLAGERARLSPNWTAAGVVYVQGGSGVDTVAAALLAARLSRELHAAPPKAAIDPVVAYYRGLLDCPRILADAARRSEIGRLDSTCNYR